MGFKIQSLWAFVSVDPKDGEEGVVASLGKEGWRPMVGADEARVKSLWPLALDIEKKSGVPVKLLRFTSREEIERP